MVNIKEFWVKLWLYKLLYEFFGFISPGIYGVFLEFEKRMGVNMQEINSKPWIMGRIMEGANPLLLWRSVIV